MLGIGIIGCGAFLFYFFGIELGIKTSVTFSGKNRLPLYLAMLAIAIYYAFYVYSIFLFKKNITSFIKLKIFTNQVINNFKIMGIIYLVGYIASVISNSVIPFYFNDLQGIIGIDYNEKSLTGLFDFPLNGFIMGLFFLVLSKVFQIAKIQKEENIELKQENELTI